MKEKKLKALLEHNRVEIRDMLNTTLAAEGHGNQARSTSLSENPDNWTMEERKIYSDLQEAEGREKSQKREIEIAMIEEKLKSLKVSMKKRKRKNAARIKKELHGMKNQCKGLNSEMAALKKEINKKVLRIKELERQVELIKDIIGWIAFADGVSYPQTLLKEICKDYRNYYKKCNKEKRLGKPTRIQDYIDVDYKEVI